MSITPSDKEINLKEIFLVLWGKKIFITLITSIFAIGSVFYALQLSNYYVSESVLVARDDSQSQIMLSQYAGMASLVGISLPSSGNKVLEVIELIKSREFVKHLLTFENILPSIMAAKGFDSNSKELTFDPEIYDLTTKTWTRKPGRNNQIKPTYIEAHEVFNGSLLSIAQDIKTGFVSIQVEHISPVFAKEFLELIIIEANTLKRNKDIEASSQALKYLKAESSRTSLVGIKESINALISAQLNTQMLAQVHEDYVLITLEPPFVPEKKSKPIRSLICFLGTLIGGMLSVFIVLIRHYYFDEIKKNKISN